MEPRATDHLAPLLYFSFFRPFVASLLGIVIAIMLSHEVNTGKTAVILSLIF